MTHAAPAFLELDPTHEQPQNPSFNTAGYSATARGAATTAEPTVDEIADFVRNEWDQPDIANGIRSFFASRAALSAAAPQAQPSPQAPEICPQGPEVSPQAPEVAQAQPSTIPPALPEETGWCGDPPPHDAVGTLRWLRRNIALPEGFREHVDGLLASSEADTDVNAPWLSLAHIICADAGIPPGHITTRLEALRDKLNSAGQAAQPSTIPLDPQSTGMMIKRLVTALRVRAPDHHAVRDGLKFLTVYDLAGSPLRDVGEAAQPSTIPPAPCPECNSNYPLHDLDCNTGRERRAAKKAAAEAAQPCADTADKTDSSPYCPHCGQMDGGTL